MSILFPYEGRLYAAERIVGKKDNGASTTTGNLYLRLFKNNLTPSVNTVFADFTECNYTGYEAIPLAALSWNSATLDSDDLAVTTYPAQLFTPTGSAIGNDAYGYYVTSDPELGDDRVLFCERFSGARHMNSIAESTGIGLVLRIGNISAGLTLPKEGRTLLLDKLTGKRASRVALALRLFKNNPDLTVDTVLADLETATYSGYADASLAYTGWQVAVLNAASRGQINQGAITTFGHNGGDVNNAIHGYAVHESGKILWCEEFDEPFNISGDNPSTFLQGRFEIGVPPAVEAEEEESSES